jgi:HSP20 family protein
MRGEISMSSHLPEKKNHSNDLIKSMNQFFTERPVKGILESIDEFFKTPYLSFPMETVEYPNEYVITAELPGIKKDQIQIDIMGNQLSVLINNTEEFQENDDTHQMYRRRRKMQSTSRSIHLPFPINEKHVKAIYKDGLLQIKIRKTGKSIQIE